jgi:pimeloyl-ACP methyl ester carboxylesterase
MFKLNRICQLVLWIGVLAPAAWAQTARVPVSPAPNESPASFAYISADGNTVVFASSATNLVAGDTNGVADVFSYDVVNQTTTKLNVDPTLPAAPIASTIGSGGGGGIVSEDGRYVVYEQGRCIWLDRQTGTRKVLPESNPSGGAVPRFCTISPDGRYVGYVTSVQAGIRFDATCLMFDTQTETSVIVSRTPSGIRGTGTCRELSISRNGDFAAFSSEAADLVANDTNGFKDVFIWQRSNNLVTRIQGASQPNEESFRTDISGDGSKIVFQSRATNMLAGGASPAPIWDGYLFNRLTSQLQRINLNSAGAPSTCRLDWTQISDDGRYASFASECELAAPNHASRGIFRRDLVANTVVQMVTPDGTTSPNGISDRPDVARNGRVVFGSNASNLIAGDTSNFDLFTGDRGVQSTGTPPTLSYTPAQGTSLGFVDGTQAISISPNGGTGSGSSATTVFNQCAFTGGGASAFSASNVSLSFAPGGAAQVATFACTRGATAQNATLTCSETRGTSAAEQRSWPVVCPVNPQAPTTTTYLGTTPATGVQFDPVVIRFSVTGINTPSGTVSVVANPGNLTCTTTVAAGECSVLPQTAGTLSVAINYAGNGNNAASNASGSFTVAANTAVAPTLDFNPSDEAVPIYVQNEIARVEVIPQGGSGAGNNSISSISCGFQGSGSAQFAIVSNASPTFGVGSLRSFIDFSCTRTAAQADAVLTCIGRRGVNGPSIVKSLNLICPPSAGYSTTVSVGDVIPNQPNQFQSTEVRANVFTNQNINPSGSLEVVANPGRANCVMQSDNWGPATAGCNLPPMPPGSYTLTYRYAGDSAFAASTATATLNVVRPQPSLSIANASPGGANQGQPITVRFDLASQYPIEPTGTIRIALTAPDTGCEIQLPQRECTVRLGRVGTIPLLASYLGDDNFGPSNSNTFNVTGFASTQTTVFIEQFNPGLPAANQNIVATVRVVGNNPSGLISLTSSGQGTLCTTPISNGVASCVFAFNQPNTYQISASFGGDGNNQAASSGTYSLVVGGGGNASAPNLSYVPAAGQQIGLVNGMANLSISTSGGSGAGVQTTLNCRASSGFSPSTLSLQFSPGQAPRQQQLFCSPTSTVTPGTLTCDELRVGQAQQQRSWPLSCAAGSPQNISPNLSYTPTVNGTILLANGAGQLLVTPSGGAGSGVSTLSGCSASNISVSPTSLSFTAGGSAQSLSLSCTRGTTTFSRTLTCTESIGGVSSTRSWTVQCPATAAPSQSANLTGTVQVVRINPITSQPNYSTIVHEGDKPVLEIELENTGTASYNGQIKIDFDSSLGVDLTQSISVPAGQKRVFQRAMTPDGLAWRQSRISLQRQIVSVSANNSLFSERVSILVRPRPLILVNGWASSGSTWDLAKIELLNAGYAASEIDAATYNSRVGENCVLILCTAEKLRDQITAMRRAKAALQVDLIGHSRGGLTSRAYVGQHMTNISSGDIRPIVNRLITFGTPHRGTTCGEAGALATPVAYFAAYFGVGFSPEPIATSELSVTYSVLAFNPLFPLSQPSLAGVQAFAFGGVTAASLGCAPRPQDLVVPSSSALNLGAGWKCPAPPIGSIFNTRGRHDNLHSRRENVLDFMLPTLSGAFDSASQCPLFRSVEQDDSFASQLAHRSIRDFPSGAFALSIENSGLGSSSLAFSATDLSEVRLEVGTSVLVPEKNGDRYVFDISSYAGEALTLKGVNAAGAASVPLLLSAAEFTVPLIVQSTNTATDTVVTMTSTASLSDLPPVLEGVFSQSESRPVTFMRQANGSYQTSIPLASITDGSFVVTIDRVLGRKSVHVTYFGQKQSDAIFASGFE